MAYNIENHNISELNYHKKEIFFYEKHQRNH